jgi:hypothetical protein
MHLGFTGSQPQATSIPSLALTFRQCLQHCPDGATWVLHDLTLTDDGETITEAIFSGCCVAVSNGSNKDGIGTMSWVLEGFNSKH